jgi:hypothetical protein
VTEKRNSSLEATLREQAKSNRSTAEVAELYAGHRVHLTAAILALSPANGGKRICLLGAGNCHDVDLGAVGATYTQIHLVDLDPAAVARARDRQEASLRASIFTHAPIDLTGLLGRMDLWRNAPPTSSELATAIDRATDQVVRSLPGGFDAVVSCCLMTQMSRACTTALGSAHPRLADVRRAIATIHLRTLAALLRTGGSALLATDLVSNETYPLDELPPDQDMSELERTLVQQDNLFLGSDPRVLGQILRRDPILSTKAGPPRPLIPWLWNAGPDRTFLVNGFVFSTK